MAFYVDVQASRGLLGAAVAGKKYDDVFRMERHVLFPKLLSKIADDFYIENTSYGSEPLRPGTPRRYLRRKVLEAKESILLELSLFSVHLPRCLGSIFGVFGSGEAADVLSRATAGSGGDESSTTTNCYTLQVSYHGYYDKSTLGQRVIPYTAERCIYSLLPPILFHAPTLCS